MEFCKTVTASLLIVRSGLSTINLLRRIAKYVPAPRALTMHSYQQTVIPDRPLELSLKWENAFQDLLNEIYFEGYAQQLLVENPTAYQSEYYYFISLYDEPPPN